MLSTKEFIAKLPKAEMHVHLEGTVPWSWIRQRSEEDLPENPAWLANDYRFGDFSEFGNLFYQGYVYVLLNAQGYGELAQYYFQKLVNENVRYVEVSIAIDSLIRRNISVNETIEAVQKAIPDQLIARIIGGINRRTDGDLKIETRRAILETPGIVGIDLHGDERLDQIESFRTLFAEARDKNYLLRAHAGELTGPETIRKTLDLLRVSRIEHGISAQGNEDLIERFIEDNITLDMCPTSNVKLRAVESWQKHPMVHFLRHGVSVTCSTDDPGIFGTSPMLELESLAHYHQLTLNELAQLQINAFNAALIDAQTHQSLRDEVHRLLS